jgi:hypothetical protein
MDTPARPQITHRIHLLLRRELGQGIDEARTLADPLYARDVLLVCDAMPGSELAALAQQFRALAPPEAPAAAADGGTASRWPRGDSGFAPSGLAAPDGVPAASAGGSPAAPRRWLSPSRWLGRA